MEKEEDQVDYLQNILSQLLLGKGKAGKPITVIRVRNREEEYGLSADSDLPSTTWTTILLRKFDCEKVWDYIKKEKKNWESLKTIISLDTVGYVTNEISTCPDCIFPFQVDGDGNCLLYSLSYMIWGTNAYYKVLRRLIEKDLILHREFYQNSISKLSDSQIGYSQTDYEKFINDAKRPNGYLGLIHIFVLSNILKRPIILYASQEDITSFGSNEDGISGVFLPTRVGLSECKGSPLALAWSNKNRNHYVPVFLVEGNSSFSWPLLGVAYSKTLKNGETAELYIKQGNQAILRESGNFKVIPVPGIPTSQEFLGDPDMEITLCGFDETIEYRRGENPEDAASSFVSNSQFPDEFTNPTETISSILTYEWSRLLSGENKSRKIPYFLSRSQTNYESLVFKGPYVTYEVARCKQMLDKIIEFNSKVIFEAPNVALTQTDISELNDLLMTIHKNPKGSPGYNNVLFRPNGFKVVTKLLEWPADKVWPAIDLARVLIPYDDAANFYRNQDFGKPMIQRIIKWSVHEPASYQVRLLCVQFMMNMFGHSELRKVLLYHQKDFATLSYYHAAPDFENENQNQKISELISLFYKNFALLWSGGNYGNKDDHDSAAHYIIEGMKKIIANNMDRPSIIKNVLISLGTILLSDARLSTDFYVPMLTNYNLEDKPEESKMINEYVAYLKGISEAQIELVVAKIE